MAKKIEPPMKTFHVEFTTIGRGSSIIKATTIEKARELARAYEFGIGNDVQHEWEYDEVDVSSVREVK